MFYYNNQVSGKDAVLTFRRFARKSYAVFSSLGREVHVGVLAVSTLACAHNAVLASRSDSLEIVQQKMSDSELPVATVSGRLPLSPEKSAYMVDVITREEIEKAHVQSINDLLKLCTNIDMRQRGAFGIQTDIGVGGGTFEQICILLNGVCINNPQSGHLTADFPVGPMDIERIEVYDGASARSFGSQALNGAINIITRQEKQTDTSIGLQAGSYGTIGAAMASHTSSQRVVHHASAGGLRSDGAVDNSDFTKLRAFYQGTGRWKDVQADWQAGYSGQRFGANTFYSAAYPDQWERTNRIFLSGGCNWRIGSFHLQPRLSWTRSYDHFQLIRHTHTGENFHRGDVLTGELGGYWDWLAGRTAIGGEVRKESILSTNLGRPTDDVQHVEGHKDILYDKKDHRYQSTCYLEHKAQISNVMMSGGFLLLHNSTGANRFAFCPGVNVSWKPLSSVKLYASWNRSMRLPSFTDLYYKSPTQEGNKDLRPEKMNTMKLGVEYSCHGLSASLQSSYRHGKDMIDWVMYSPDDIFHSTQFALNNWELLWKGKADFCSLMPSQSWLESLDMSCMYNYQTKKEGAEVYKSNYSLEYLRWKIRGGIHFRFFQHLQVSGYVSWQKRMGGYLDASRGAANQYTKYSPYAVADIKLSWDARPCSLFLSLENVGNHKYFDYGNVPQPGFVCLGGVSVRF